MSLSQLPAGTWKMHEGDLPHGEAVTLDESGWQDAATGARYSTNAVWFRQTIQVPATLNGYDLTGARIWFQFTADANGPVPEIIYFNGRRVALGEDLEPVVLFDNARPGDKVVVAVKLLQTVDMKSSAARPCAWIFRRAGPIRRAWPRSFFRRRCCCPRLRRTTAQSRGILNNAIAAVDLARAGCARSGQVRRQPEDGAERSLKRCGRCCSRPRSASTATRTSTRRGCGRGPKPWTWCSAPLAPRCS